MVTPSFLLADLARGAAGNVLRRFIDGAAI